jgi:hypothetical protein
MEFSSARFSARSRSISAACRATSARWRPKSSFSARMERVDVILRQIDCSFDMKNL